MVAAAMAWGTLCGPLGWSPPRAHAAPEPALVPQRWQLDIEPGPLRLTTVQIEEEFLMADGSVEIVSRPEAYFYFTYLVENNSGKDLRFAPIFELATEEGDLVRSGRGVSLAVRDELLARLKNPLLEDELDLVGRKIEQGEENALEGLVIWPAGSLKVDELTIFARGFSGETERVRRPDTGREVVLHKTLMLRHHVPGSLDGVYDEPLERAEKRWIMR